jgi:hypothetical protein
MRDGDDDEGGGGEDGSAWTGWEDDENSWASLSQALTQAHAVFKQAVREQGRGGASGKDAALVQLADQVSAVLSKELKADRRLGRAQTCDGVRAKFAQRIREGFKAHGGVTPASNGLLNRALEAAAERGHQAHGDGRGVGARHGDGDEDDEEDYDAENLEDEDDDGDGDGGGRLGSGGLPQMDGADVQCLPQTDGVVSARRGASSCRRLWRLSFMHPAAHLLWSRRKSGSPRLMRRGNGRETRTWTGEDGGR